MYPFMIVTSNNFETFPCSFSRKIFYWSKQKWYTVRDVQSKAAKRQNKTWAQMIENKITEQGNSFTQTQMLLRLGRFGTAFQHCIYLSNSQSMQMVPRYKIYWSTEESFHADNNILNSICMLSAIVSLHVVHK